MHMISTIDQTKDFQVRIYEEFRSKAFQITFCMNTAYARALSGACRAEDEHSFV